MSLPRTRLQEVAFKVCCTLPAIAGSQSHLSHKVCRWTVVSSSTCADDVAFLVGSLYPTLTLELHIVSHVGLVRIVSATST